VTSEFKSFFSDFLRKNTDEAENLEAKINFDAWLLLPGMPPNPMDFTTSLTEFPRLLAEAWVMKGSRPSQFDDYNTYLYEQKVIFLNTLLSSDQVTSKLVDSL